MKVKKIKLIVTREYEVRMYGDASFDELKKEIIAYIKDDRTACSCSRYGFDWGKVIDVKEAPK